MATKNIAIYGGGWIHNMGNSFIQIGSKYTIEQAVPGAVVHMMDRDQYNYPTTPLRRVLDDIGHFPLLSALRKPERAMHAKRSKQEVRLDSFAQLDAIVLSGVWLTARYLIDHMPVFMELKNKGVKMIMNGVGGTKYMQEEYDQVRGLLEKIGPYAIITRDDVVFEAYKDVIPNMTNGIDVGFFVADAFPHPFTYSKREVCCFDRTPIPAEAPVKPDTIITHHSRSGLQHHDYENHTVLYSQLAEDYLNLYANCSTVYSDRVHACVATLAYGNKARLIDKTPRAHLFETVKVGDVRTTVVQLDTAVFEAKKKQHLEGLTRLLKDL